MINWEDLKAFALVVWLIAFVMIAPIVLFSFGLAVAVTIFRMVTGW